MDEPTTTVELPEPVPAATTATETPTNGDLRVTSPESYQGFSKPTLVTLPSQAVFLLRKPKIWKMVRQGQIPNPLMEVVNLVFQERDSAEVAAMAAEREIPVEAMRAELEREKADEPPGPPDVPELTAQDGFRFMDVVVWASIVEPTVEFEPQVSEDSPLTASGALSYDALDDEDVRYIMAWANGEADTIATFPQELGRPGADSGSGEVRAEAVRPAGDPAAV